MMAGANGSLQPTHQTKQTLERLFPSLDSKSLILSQFGTDHKPNLLQLTTKGLVMEKGPRYKAYSELRELRLRMKNTRDQSQEHEHNLSPPKQQVKLQGISPANPNRRRMSSVLARSVPDFSAVVRKERRKPASMLPPMMPSSNLKMSVVGAKSGGTMLAIEQKRGLGGLTTRKSNASVEELKRRLLAAENAINGEE